MPLSSSSVNRRIPEAKHIGEVVDDFLDKVA
jgi:hypothetical protein